MSNNKKITTVSRNLVPEPMFWIKHEHQQYKRYFNTIRLFLKFIIDILLMKT